MASACLVCTGPGAVAVVLRARDRAVCVLDRLRVPDDERGARVGDAVDRGRLEGARADGVARRHPLPEAVAGRDGRVGDGALVGGGVDVAEAVRASCIRMSIVSAQRGFPSVCDSKWQRVLLSKTHERGT